MFARILVPSLPQPLEFSKPGQEKKKCIYQPGITREFVFCISRKKVLRVILGKTWSDVFFPKVFVYTTLAKGGVSGS